MHQPSTRNDAQWLHEEIGLLEARLAEISAGRDSAYEKALIRTYENLIRDCRSRLAALHGMAPGAP
jgi:hypothetical protein